CSSDLAESVAGAFSGKFPCIKSVMLDLADKFISRFGSKESLAWPEKSGSDLTSALSAKSVEKSSCEDASGNFCTARPAISFFSAANFIRCLFKAVPVPSRGTADSKRSCAAMGTSCKAVDCGTSEGNLTGLTAEASFPVGGAFAGGDLPASVRDFMAAKMAGFEAGPTSPLTNDADGD